MVEIIYHLINHYTAPLYKSLYSSTYFFIDYWSFVHILSGILILFQAKRLGWRHPFRVLGIILVAWEILETFFIYIAVRIFNAESIPDQFTDIIIGFMGGYIGFLLFKPGGDRVGS